MTTYLRTKQWLQARPLSAGLMLLVLITVIIFLTRVVTAVRLRHDTLNAAVPVVHTIQAKEVARQQTIYLPGMAMGWHAAPLYARTEGYLKEWYVDIGWRVHKGDVLAIIERPELDARFYEAKAYLDVVTAQNELAQITARRWNNLVRTDSVSKQANDNKSYEAQALSAELVKARANLADLQALVSFEQIIAPFDGVISLRQTDIGQLINIGSAPSEALPLFTLVQFDKLRLYVNIPQTYSTQITPDMQVSMQFAEHPGRKFPARLLKTANAINPETLTLQAEFEVQNQDEVLMPGSYTLVEFTLPVPTGRVIIPVNTLIFRAEGLQVAKVDDKLRVHLQDITMGTDFGGTVQINHGIKPGERLIINPTDSIYEGQAVRLPQPAAESHA